MAAPLAGGWPPAASASAWSEVGRPPRVVSLLPCATDCVVALGLEGVLVGRSHECDDGRVAAVPVCTQPKLHMQQPDATQLHALAADALTHAGQHHAPHDGVVFNADLGDASAVSSPPAAATAAAAEEVHLAASAAAAAAWELGWRAGGASASAVTLVQWSLSPYFTLVQRLQELRADVVLTQAQFPASSSTSATPCSTCPANGVCACTTTATRDNQTPQPHSLLSFGLLEISAAAAEVLGNPSLRVVHCDPLTLRACLHDQVVAVAAATRAPSAATQNLLASLRSRVALVRDMCRGRSSSSAHPPSATSLPPLLQQHQQQHQQWRRPRVICLQWLHPAFIAGAWVPQIIRLAGGEPPANPRVGPWQQPSQPPPQGQQHADSVGELWEGLRKGGGPGAGCTDNAEDSVEVAGSEELRGWLRWADVAIVALCGCDLRSSFLQAQEALLPLLQQQQQQQQQQPKWPAAQQQQGRKETASLPGAGGAGGVSEEGSSGEDGWGKGWARVAVVEGTRVLSRGGPLLVESLEVVAEILHPEVQSFGHQGRLWLPVPVHGTTSTPLLAGARSS